LSGSYFSFEKEVIPSSRRGLLFSTAQRALCSRSSRRPRCRLGRTLCRKEP
jgi:hypothetical protein